MLTDNTEAAELAVLGAVIATGGKCLDDIGLTADDFDSPTHATMFKAMRDMHSQGKHVDTITLSSLLPDRAADVFMLSDHAPFASAVDHYADIVASHGMYRRMVAVSDALRGLSPELSVADMTERARQLVDDASGTQKSKVRFVRDIMPDVITKLQTKATFTPTPWPSLNAAIGGLRPGAVYVVAARPGMGKSVVAAQLASRLAQEGMVAFSALEMSEADVVGRMISERLDILVGKVKDNRMTQRDWDILHSRRDELDNLNIAIDDRSEVGAGDVRAFARSVSRHGKLAGVVVDYMQLMTSRSKMDRHLQVSEFSRQLKILAKDMNVPVIALSQLNRQSEARADSVPKLSDLRESGAIEQDADVVLLLRRQGESPGEELVIDVAKNRHGETGLVHLAWEGQYSRATEWDSLGSGVR